MRLQVFLSKAGIASRRAAINIIRSGKIRVNGKVILEPAFNVDPEKDNIFFSNKKLLPRKKVYIMLHKPAGVTTTKKDPFAKKTVIDLLPGRFRHLNPVGRLDKDTTGLILLTNDGDLMNKLTHPRFNIQKVYAVTLDKRLADRDRLKLEKGVDLDGKRTAPCRIKSGKGNDLEITLREGRKRQIKRMISKRGHTVVKLKRFGEGVLSLGGLAEGKWKFLTKKEVCMLLSK